ncbi:intradiol ring-cleavage dioxygenase [Streptomyces sp. NPDC058683]|uniref:intradiol ring-cleavage dioxygenase n=1 Tax=Streptomyces sp. NPDC058683 TaxID=3346597 RepID=UPI003650BB94
MTDNQQSPESQKTDGATELTRRKVVVAGTGAVAAVGLGGAFAANAVAGERKPAGPARPAPLDDCYQLTSEAVEGPYYIDADKIRRNVTEDRPGIPLTLALRVIDSETCRPVRDAAVDIWHCDAIGVYSGYEEQGNGGGGGGGPAPTGSPTGTPTAVPTGPPPGGGTPGGHQDPTDDKRYLRGTWRTDRHGRVTFKTVFPGWYRGRCVHIHVKVHVDGEWTDAGYEGGHTCHTGQFFFEEEAVIATTTLDPYVTNIAERTTLTEDTIYDQSGTQGGLLKLRYRRNDIARGVQGSITMSVDRDATNDGEGGGPPPSASPSASAS